MTLRHVSNIFDAREFSSREEAEKWIENNITAQWKGYYVVKMV
jgi:hypothetical protein